MMHKFVRFIDQDIWRIRSRTLPRKKYYFLKIVRVFLLAIREFRSNKCQLNASALTFYSLLSIVPVVAMAFGIAKGFGFERVLEKQLLGKFPGQEETFSQVFFFANNLLENTRGGLVAGVGVILLFWTVIKVLNSIETSFNDIWGIRAGRPFGRKVSDYLSIMLICPFLLIASSGATVFITTQVTSILQKLTFLGPVAGVIMAGLRLLPYCLVWFLFTFVYLFMPNTKVHFSAGLMAGIVAGTIYQLIQVVYVAFQVGVAKANAIYGSFAALPLFLMWLQVSWRVVLFGTELAFAYQNVETYEFEHDCLNANRSFKNTLALEIVSLLAKRFAAGEAPLTASGISERLDIPIRLCRDLLFELTEARLLSEMRGVNDRQMSYQPARDINTLTIAFVLEELERKGLSSLPVVQSEEFKRLEEALGGFRKQLRQSPSNKLLKDL